MSKTVGLKIASCLVGFAIVGQASLAVAQDEAAAAPAASAAAAPEAAPAAQPGPVATGVVVAAPEDENKDKFAMGIFFNPVSLLFGFYGLELDFSPQHLYSINVSGQYYSRNLLGIKTEAYGADLGVQFFLTGHKPMHGAYLYPRIAYAKAKASFEDAKSEANLVGIGITAGYQWNWQPFSLRLGGGIMDYMGSAKATSGSTSAPEISLTGVMPAIDLTLGFVF
jgi:hypothetical protein